ncbi:hypothetical protein [Ostreiculturibacter nitratireducens]|uniref:hypothetical protein n=1 Tax=Ostreiculturibacter nitratireducens TaxID=3075226 RepID=UPI0031B5A594
MRRAALALLLLVAACATPQERCIQTATRELRTVNELIAEIEGNLARGYAYQTYEITRPVWAICDWLPPAKEGGRPRPHYCLEDETETIRRRVAIVPDLERRKLVALREKQAELTRIAAAEIAACKAKYPE